MQIFFLSADFDRLIIINYKKIKLRLANHNLENLERLISCLVNINDVSSN